MNTTKRIPTLLAAAAFLSVLGSAQAQLNEAQQKCVGTLNKDGAAVAKAQGKASSGCLKAAGSEASSGAAQACLTADPKQRIAKKVAKAVLDDAERCADTPSFGYSGGSAAATAAMQGSLALFSDVFGADLDTAAVHCESQRDRCKCQQQIWKQIDKHAALLLKTVVKCEKNILSTAIGASDLSKCLTDAGTSGSLAQLSVPGETLDGSVGKLAKAIIKSCDDKGVVAGSFPGACSDSSGAGLADCLDQLARCRACQTINGMNQLATDCDSFDDGTANLSCGVVPPTVAPTVTPTATATA
ncbi:MAG TPA: hypothetical protein VEB21_04865, partial [Terriglobales bacterium]|nr:hypothetical protein [Terriglobales bacterium]